MTLAEIRAAAAPDSFPVDAVRGCKTAACLYAAGFLGRNDVIHLLDAGIDHAVLVDPDEGKLDEMFRIYPAGWNYLPESATEFARRELRLQHRYDVVTVDPWTNEIPSALLNLPAWLQITRRVLVIGVCLDWFLGKHLPSNLDGFNAWIDRAHWNGAPTPPHATALHRRSSYRGGVWWAVLEVKP